MPDQESAQETLVEISRNEFDPCTKTNASITDVKHLASYNWIEAATPTIAVPGSPALWSAPQTPQHVKKDSGLVYIAQNAARYPDSPLEPLFRSLYIEQPLFDINPIDVVTDRNNIRKLLSFIKPTLTRNGLDPFTIQVDMASHTAIFCRDETATYEVIGPTDFRGFGHEFEKAYTIAQVEGSTGHHRIVSYQLGGLSFLVRHETDGCVGDSSPVEKDHDSTGDSLAKILKSMSLSSESETRTPNDNPVQSALTIKRLGQIVPRESTLEIKTRVFHKPLQIGDIAPQLWISQTPKLVRAYHQRGTFSRPKVEDVTAAVKAWEQTHQDDIRKLVALIKHILRVTRSWGGTSTIRYDLSKDKLLIEKVDRKKMLPDDLYSRWTKVIPARATQKLAKHDRALSNTQRHTTGSKKNKISSSRMKAKASEGNISTVGLGNRPEP